MDTINANLIYQPQVYELALYLAKRSEVKYVIAIGSGKDGRLKPFFDYFNITAVDSVKNLQILREKYKKITNITYIDCDLNKGVPNISNKILANSVVIVADVIEYVIYPDSFLKWLKDISFISKYLLISTPDRDRVEGIGNSETPSKPAHVREWNLPELTSLSQSFSFNHMLMGYTINNSCDLSKTTILIISGKEVAPQKHQLKRILAIIHAYNESDFIVETIEHLLSQGIDVCINDDFSNDGSYELLKIKYGNHPRVFIERIVREGSQEFRLEELLKLTEKLSKRYDNYDWYIHQDIDELRYPPWSGISLQEAISFVDDLGYNAIDFTVVDFRFTNNFSGTPPKYEDTLGFFEFGTRPGHFIQIKCWKGQDKNFDLSSTGGHEVKFPNRRVYPLKFLIKHYPLRSLEQARKKIYQDRIGRVKYEKEHKGWHGQYDNYQNTQIEPWDEKNLIKWNEKNFASEYLIERISGIGLQTSSRDKEKQQSQINLRYYTGNDAYSDGDIENDILDIVKSTKEYNSILSKDNRWPVLYHLSPIRRNLLVWYPFKKDASLLEIGAGCGGLTGLFCEKVKHVTAIELSKRRAEIIYHRYKHLDNLEIIVGNLTDIDLNTKFEYITLIGVLEYAPLFIKDQNSSLKLLKLVKELLTPDGRLFLAIENKFGLKYFAGGKEDHSGKMFDGIEGYMGDNTVRTFGKNELENLLVEAGFTDYSFYYPYPDYKLPLIIHSDDYLPLEIDCLWSGANYDNDRFVLFKEHLAFREIIKNHQYPLFANSFLIEAKV